MVCRKGLLITVVVVVVLLLAGTPAQAGTDYDFISGQSWLPPEATAVELGSLVIKIDPLLEGEHAAIFALPGRFKVQLPGAIESLENAGVSFTAEALGEHEFIGRITATDSMGKYTFVVPIHSTIPSGVKGDFELTITTLQGQLNDGVVRVGSALPSEVKIESSRVKLMKDGEATVEITFDENMAGLLRKGSPVKLTLPEGFVWTAAEGAVVGGEGLKARPVIDGRVLEIRTDTESTKRAVLRVGAELAADAERAVPGEVRAKVTGFRSVSPSTILVAHYAAPEPEPEPDVERTAVFTIGALKYTVDGKAEEMDAAPYVKNGRTFLPLRFVGESVGAAVDWDGKTATLTRGDTVVKAAAGAKSMEVDGVARAIDAAAEMAAPGRIMLPYRAVAEAFGAYVHWDGVARTVTMRR